MVRKGHAEMLAKQARAIELRIGGHSFDEIASELGFANRGSAFKTVTAGLRERRDDLAGHYLQIQIDRYETILRAWWDKATVRLDAKAANIVLRVLERLDRLLRLDRPDAAITQETIVISADPEQYVKDLQRIDAEREAARAALGRG